MTSLARSDYERVEFPKSFRRPGVTVPRRQTRRVSSGIFQGSCTITTQALALPQLSGTSTVDIDLVHSISTVFEAATSAEYRWIAEFTREPIPMPSKLGEQQHFLLFPSQAAIIEEDDEEDSCCAVSPLEPLDTAKRELPRLSCFQMEGTSEED
jgi:hypothetical protein